MIRRSTWIMLLLLAALVGAYFLINRQKNITATAATATPGTSYVFTSQDGLPSDIKMVSSSGTTVEFARDTTGKWVVKAPTNAPADQASAESAATQVTSLQIVGAIQIGLDVVGLDNPAYALTLTFTSGKTHILKVGSETPIQSGYYTQLDGGKIQVVDKQGLDSLLTLVGNPPYVPTATPAVIDTPTPEPNLSTPTAAASSSTGTANPAPAMTEAGTKAASTATP